jgi:hypothetical protein
MTDVFFTDLSRARKYCGRLDHWLLVEPKGGWRVVETRARAVEVAGEARVQIMDEAQTQDEPAAQEWTQRVTRLQRELSGALLERDARARTRRSGRAVAQ